MRSVTRFVRYKMYYTVFCMASFVEKKNNSLVGTNLQEWFSSYTYKLMLNFKVNWELRLIKTNILDQSVPIKPVSCIRINPSGLFRINYSFLNVFK